MKFTESMASILAILSLVSLLNLTGCSGVLPATLQEKLEAGGTADDHIAAAMLYQAKVRELEAEAVEYEIAVSKFGASRDSKGFHHDALRMAAQQKRYDAQQMQELYAAHLAQAQALHGKISPQYGSSSDGGDCASPLKDPTDDPMAPCHHVRR